MSVKYILNFLSLSQLIIYSNLFISLQSLETSHYKQNKIHRANLQSVPTHLSRMLNDAHTIQHNYRSIIGKGCDKDANSLMNNKTARSYIAYFRKLKNKNNQQLGRNSRKLKLAKQHSKTMVEDYFKDTGHFQPYIDSFYDSIKDALTDMGEEQKHENSRNIDGERFKIIKTEGLLQKKYNKSNKSKDLSRSIRTLKKIKPISSSDNRKEIDMKVSLNHKKHPSANSNISIKHYDYQPNSISVSAQPERQTKQGLSSFKPFDNFEASNWNDNLLAIGGISAGAAALNRRKTLMAFKHQYLEIKNKENIEELKYEGYSTLENSLIKCLKGLQDPKHQPENTYFAVIESVDNSIKLFRNMKTGNKSLMNSVEAQVEFENDEDDINLSTTTTQTDTNLPNMHNKEERTTKRILTENMRYIT